jgi:hypothetical protein
MSAACTPGWGCRRQEARWHHGWRRIQSTWYPFTCVCPLAHMFVGDVPAHLALNSRLVGTLTRLQCMSPKHNTFLCVTKSQLEPAIEPVRKIRRRNILFGFLGFCVASCQLPVHSVQVCRLLAACTHAQTIPRDLSQCPRQTQHPSA